jgi:FAD/FMN-containing dehydrogenase
MSVVDDVATSILTGTFSGSVLAATDEGYGAALAAAVWNGDIRRRPALIVRPGSTAEVARALEVARHYGVGVTVRGGGHSFAGHAVAQDAVMIDLGRLNQISVDPKARRVRCGGGTTWAEMDAATAEHGFAVPGGFISHTGVAGLTLGGGLGWLSRPAGLSCDNLVSAEVVTADGRVVTASDHENADLFWALRGGGGNYGIVTSFEFALHQLSPMANLGLFFWRPQEAQEALRFARDLIPDLPGDMGGFVAGLNAPPAPFVPAQHHGIPGFAVAVVNWDSAEEHARVIAPLRDLNPLFELVTPIPHVALQQMFDDSAPWGILAYEKAIYLDALTDDVIDIMIEQLPAKASPGSFIPIFALGGAYARVPEDQTAFGGSRQTRWALNITAIATDKAAFAHDRNWVRDFWAELRPHANSSGSYINFLADDDEERIRASYGEKYDRLAAIKATWDPNNVFHHNANIRPAANASPRE